MTHSQRDRLRIGMTYEELVRLLGPPTRVNEGSSLLRGETVLASQATRAAITNKRFCRWERPEATYDLTISNDRLESIYHISENSP